MVETCYMIHNQLENFQDAVSISWQSSWWLWGREKERQERQICSLLRRTSTSSRLFTGRELGFVGYPHTNFYQLFVWESKSASQWRFAFSFNLRLIHALKCSIANIVYSVNLRKNFPIWTLLQDFRMSWVHVFPVFQNREINSSKPKNVSTLFIKLKTRPSQNQT